MTIQPVQTVKSILYAIDGKSQDMANSLHALACLACKDENIHLVAHLVKLIEQQHTMARQLRQRIGTLDE